MAEKRIRYPLLWIGFLGVMVVGAAFVSNPDGRWQALGFVLLGAPLLVLAAATIVYYLLERRRSSP